MMSSATQRGEWCDRRRAADAVRFASQGEQPVRGRARVGRWPTFVAMTSRVALAAWKRRAERPAEAASGQRLLL